MSDHPPENPGTPLTGEGHEAARSLSDIVEALARVTGTPHGESAAMREAVAELSRSLSTLFEMVRADRAEDRARIAELEAALSSAHAHIRQLEAGEAPKVPAPPPNDFGQLRDAAERLRQRTEELFRDAGTPLDRQRREAEQAGTDDADRRAHDERLDHARRAVEASLAEDAVRATPPPQEPQQLGGNAPPHDEPFGKPGVLRIFPGAVLRPGGAESLDVESDLDVDPEFEEPRRMAAQARPAVTEASEPEPAAVPPATVASQTAPHERESADTERTESGAAEPSAEPSAETPSAEPPSAEATSVERAPAETTSAEPTPVENPTPTSPPRSAGAPTQHSIPTAVAARPATKRRGFRRRRIDARKLTGVDPVSALRAMVSAVDDVWTAGHTLDLIIALTDGEALRVSGGHTKPLEVTEVEPGTPARTTVTATSAQLLPLFGRLELTADQSSPLIHGARRDADLLVGWIDRAQRLPALPL